MAVNTQDIRWKQRFQNFERAFILLRSALEDKKIEEFNRLEQKGLTRRFEYTYELAWKTAKDYLQEQGVILDEVTPKAVLNVIFAAGLIQDGQTWVDMRLHRNLLSHSYDGATFLTVFTAVDSRYLTALGELYAWFLARMATE